MYTLAVIDMQEDFLQRITHNKKSTKRVIDNCKAEIAKAIKDKANILFVEYSNYGETIADLTDLAKKAKYKKHFHTVKADDNGAAEISDSIKTHRLTQDKIKICGINTEYCVYATVRGLISQMKTAEIEVIADACDSPWGHESGVAKMENLSEDFPRLKVKRDNG